VARRDKVRHMNRFIVSLLVLAAVGCGSKGGKVAAVVNGHVITTQEVEERFSRLNPSVRASLGEDHSRVLDQIVTETLLFQEASRRGLDRDVEVRRLVDEARRQILVGRLLEVVQKESKAKVSDEEIAQFYEANQASFLQPESWRASHILTADEATAQKALERIKSGEPFATVAQELSTDPSKSRGGDIGFFSKGQVIPEFEAACKALKPGELSRVVKTPLGYHVIQLTEQRSARQKTLEEVKDQIRQAMESQRGQQQLGSFVQQLRSKSQVKIREVSNRAGVPSPESAAPSP